MPGGAWPGDRYCRECLTGRGCGAQAAGLLEAERAARALAEEEAVRVRQELKEAMTASAASAAEARQEQVLCSF